MTRKAVLCLMVWSVLALPATRRWNPARAQTAAPPDASGVWSGTLAGGEALELRLTQDGQYLTGTGTYLPQDPQGEVDFDLQGEVNSAGQALLHTQGIAGNTGQDSTFAVELAFSGEQSQARLVDGQSQTSRDLNMTRVLQGDPPGSELQAGSGATEGSRQLRLWNHDLTPFQNYQPPEAYRIDGQFAVEVASERSERYKIHVNVKLAGSLITEVVGSWNLDETADSRGIIPTLDNGLQFRSGRVAAWNLPISRSRMVFKTPDTLSVLADIVFERVSSGVAGDFHVQPAFVNPVSRYWVQVPNTAGGYYHGLYRGGQTVTLVAP